MVFLRALFGLLVLMWLRHVLSTVTGCSSGVGVSCVLHKCPTLALRQLRGKEPKPTIYLTFPIIPSFFNIDLPFDIFNGFLSTTYCVLHDLR